MVQTRFLYYEKFEVEVLPFTEEHRYAIIPKNISVFVELSKYMYNICSMNVFPQAMASMGGLCTGKSFVINYLDWGTVSLPLCLLF